MRALPTLLACGSTLLWVVLAAAPAVAELSVEWLRSRQPAIFEEGGVATLTLRLGNQGDRPLALLRVRGEGPLDLPLELTEPREGALVYVEEADCYELDPDQLIVSQVRSGLVLPGESVTFAVPVRLPAARRQSMPPGQGGAAPPVPMWKLQTGVTVESIEVVLGENAQIFMSAGEPDREEVGRWLPVTETILDTQSTFPALSRTFVLRDEHLEVKATRVDINLPCAGRRMSLAVEKAERSGCTPFWSWRFGAWLARGNGDAESVTTVPLHAKTITELPVDWSFDALLFAETCKRAPVPVRTPGRAAVFRELLLAYQLGIDDLSLLYPEDFDAFRVLVAEHGLTVTTSSKPLLALVVR